MHYPYPLSQLVHSLGEGYCASASALYRGKYVEALFPADASSDWHGLNDPIPRLLKPAPQMPLGI